MALRRVTHALVGMFISTPGKLKNIPNHGGNRTHDLWNSNPMLGQLSPVPLMCFFPASPLWIIINSEYTAKNATELLQFVNFIDLLQLVNKLQQACQFHQVATSL